MLGLSGDNSNHDEIRELLKTATVQAREKEYDAAIASLTRAYELMKNCSTEWGIKEYFRVARYHHLAGRYDDATNWLQQLYDNVDANADAREILYQQWGWRQKGGFSKVSQEARESRRHVICDEMELFKKRQAKIDKRRLG